MRITITASAASHIPSLRNVTLSAFAGPDFVSETLMPATEMESAEAEATDTDVLVARPETRALATPFRFTLPDGPMFISPPSGRNVT